MNRVPPLHSDPDTRHPALLRLMTLATGYVGTTTFVLVSYFSIQATKPTRGELLIDRATGAPLWVWIISITAAVAAAGLMGLLRRALITHDRTDAPRRGRP